MEGGVVFVVVVPASEVADVALAPELRGPGPASASQSTLVAPPVEVRLPAGTTRERDVELVMVG